MPKGELYLVTNFILVTTSVAVQQKAGLYAFSMQAGFGWIERASLVVKVALEATFWLLVGFILEI